MGTRIKLKDGLPGGFVNLLGRRVRPGEIVTLGSGEAESLVATGFFEYVNNESSSGNAGATVKGGSDGRDA